MCDARVLSSADIHHTPRDPRNARMQHAVADDQPVEYLDAGDDMTELCVAPFEVRGTRVHDEELTSGGVGTRIRHALPPPPFELTIIAASR